VCCIVDGKESMSGRYFIFLAWYPLAVKDAHYTYAVEIYKANII
jgi:hypothetical protein